MVNTFLVFVTGDGGREGGLKRTGIISLVQFLKHKSP
jgi:hypothetical protein